eukprot:1748559-Pyramimonas_sp.AAC.1
MSPSRSFRLGNDGRPRRGRHLEASRARGRADPLRLGRPTPPAEAVPRTQHRQPPRVSLGSGAPV